MPAVAAVVVDAASCARRADGYARRRPEDTVLHRILRAHWPAFLERAEEAGGLPKFVVREFEEYLDCGLLERGLVHLRCGQCGEDLVVAFSCKHRGFCPSCVARRMSDAAAHLVDDVFPEVPTRQWVCALPWRLRVLLGYDRALCAEVLSAFTGALTRSLRRRAKAQLGLLSVKDAYVGAVTFVQRSDASLRLNVHFHTMALDGVYVREPSGVLAFHALGAPTFDEVQQVAQWTHVGIERVLRAHGRTLDGMSDEPAELTHDQPVLASCYAASAADVQLLGDAAGQRTLKLVQAVREVRPAQRALAEFGGVNIHAEVAIDGRDRKRLEHVLRYMARPPLALDRLELRNDGRVTYRFKKAWRNGTHAVVLSPEDFIARLCALVPPPRFHLMRYLGVLAGHSSLRAQVVPKKPAALPAQLPLLDERDESTTSAKSAAKRTAEPSRHPWSWLLQRVFAVDILKCERCGGRLRIVEIAKKPDDVTRVLRERSWARAPPRAELPAFVNGQLRLEFG